MASFDSPAELGKHVSVIRPGSITFGSHGRIPAKASRRARAWHCWADGDQEAVDSLASWQTFFTITQLTQVYHTHSRSFWFSRCGPRFDIRIIGGSDGCQQCTSSFRCNVVPARGPGRRCGAPGLEGNAVKAYACINFLSTDLTKGRPQHIPRTR